MVAALAWQGGAAPLSFVPPNFLELRKAEVQLRRIPLPRTTVNKLPVNAPHPSGWHHAHGVDPLEKNTSWRGECSHVSGREQGRSAPPHRRSLQPREPRYSGRTAGPELVEHTLAPGEYSGREGLKRSVAKQRAAFSDLHNNIEEQIAEGDKVVSWVISSGTHDRERFLGLAPTGERMTMKHIFISRVVEGKIVEVWGVGDISDVWQQRLQRERIERERVEQELQVARRIQQASLPKEVPELTGWQISAFYQPAREVGGDFYDFLELADGRLGVVVGDATGKGVPAALMMASTRSTLRLAAQSSSPG